MAASSTSRVSTSTLRASTMEHTSVTSTSDRSSTPSLVRPSQFKSLLTTDSEMRSILLATSSSSTPLNQRATSSRAWTMTRKSYASLPASTRACPRTSTAALSFRSTWPTTVSRFTSPLKRTLESFLDPSSRDASTRTWTRTKSSSPLRTCPLAETSRSTATRSTCFRATSTPEIT